MPKATNQLANQVLFSITLLLLSKIANEQREKIKQKKNKIKDKKT